METAGHINTELIPYYGGKCVHDDVLLSTQLADTNPTVHTVEVQATSSRVIRWSSGA